MPDQNDPSEPVDITKQQAKRGRQEIYDDDDFLSTGTNSEIKNMLLALSQKMDTLNQTMSDNDSRLNAKIDNLETTMSNKVKVVKEEMETRILAVSKELDQRLEHALKSTITKCDDTNNSVKLVTVRMDEIRAYHESRLDRLERFSLEKDLIISGVPLENNDDPFAIIGDICGALNCNLKQGDFAAVFRLTSSRDKSKNKRTLPIVARLQDDWVKQELLSNYFKKKNLNLTDIGFKTPARIFINERLTTTNREIFNRAAEAKKSNLIHRFFTRRGLVYVQRNETSRPMCIFDVSELHIVFPLNHTRYQSRNDRSIRSVQTPLTNSVSPKPAPATIIKAQPTTNTGPSTLLMDIEQNSSEQHTNTDQRATIHDETLQNQPPSTSVIS